MFKTLLKARFASLFASMSKDSKKKNAKAMRIFTIIMFAFLGVYFVGAFSAMAVGFTMYFYPNGNGWQVFALFSVIASALCMLGSIFTAKTQIFESSDNEMLLAMPIKPRDIFFSRIAILLLINYILEALVMLPLIVVYAICGKYNFLGFVFAVLTFLILPMLTLAISSLLGWLISVISSKMRNKTLVTTVLFIAFFFAYFWFVSNIGNFMGSIDDNAELDFSSLKNTYVFYWIGDAIANGNALSFLFFLICALVPSAVTFFVLNRSFVKIITTKKGAAKIEYKEKKEKQNSVFVALVKKELNRFFTSSAYIVNEGLGNVIVLVLSVVAAFNGDKITAAASEMNFGRFIPCAAVMLVVLMSSMNFITAPSISLEDKNLWILKSSPIKPKSVLMAKIMAHIIICTPLSLISLIILCITFKAGAAVTLLGVLAVLSMIAFCGFFGMVMGLKFPKFDWQNENVAVKQGFAVFGTSFGSMLYALILCGVCVLLSLVSVYLGIIAVIVINVGVCLLLNIYFSNGAERDFRLLKQ